MKNITGIIVLIILTVTSFSTTSAKDSDTDVISLYSYDKKEGKPKVFIEGIRIDFDYLRRNMLFVDFVNDPAVADVHIIINHRTNGGGGTAYSLMYHNKSFEKLSDFSLSCTVAPGNTQEESRKIISDALSMGLMPFVNETEASNKLTFKFKNDKNEGKKNLEIKKDPWNNWTFRGDVNGNMNLEESRKNFNYSYYLRANKVTDDWKFRNNGRMTVRTVEYLSDGEKYRSENISSWFSSSIVNSISPRWSAGAFFGYSNSTYSNLIHSLSIKPAIEYNIFPWDISDRKVFTIAYYIGPEWKKYYEETIYGKLKENLWEQTFKMELQLVQTWGEIEAGLDASNFLQDFSKNRITFDTQLSVRVVRGFSVNFNFRAENIHDQIYLPKGEATLEDILLNRVQLPSSFQLYTGVGFRIQFGSIYNNIVNNRL